MHAPQAARRTHRSWSSMRRAQRRRQSAWMDRNNKSLPKSRRRGWSYGLFHPDTRRKGRTGRSAGGGTLSSEELGNEIRLLARRQGHNDSVRLHGNRHRPGGPGAVVADAVAARLPGRFRGDSIHEAIAGGRLLAALKTQQMEDKLPADCVVRSEEHTSEL